MSVTAPGPYRSMTAKGNIAPARFVKIAGGDFGVQQAAAGNACIGISSLGKRLDPYKGDDGFVAISGEGVSVATQGATCLLQAGDTVTRGDRLKSDANGKGVTAAAADSAYAVAQQSGVAGGFILVDVVYDTVGAA